MGRNTYIFAGGGTGGHLYPALAVAEELTHLDEEAMVIFACSSRAVDRRILDPLDYPICAQPVRPLTKHPFRLLGFWGAWRKSITLGENLLRDLRPKAVLGLGGFAAGPVVRVAARRGIPTALLNPDVVVGRANRYLSRRVDAVFTQFASTAGCFPSTVRDKIHTVGCPVRSQLLKPDREEGMRFFALDPARKTLLVFGGSMLASSITDAIVALGGDLDKFADDWQIILVAGPQKQTEVERTFASLAIRVVVLPYCERMDLGYAAADLVLCRGGAGTIAELTATGTPAVVLPYPHHADRQQYLNAAGLLEAAAAKIVEDRCDPLANAEALRAELLPILHDGELLGAMRTAARDFQPRHAAREVAEWLSQR
ncbi:MAG TPA: UDP-N-acetylglucosamine--N-acetylmuramyl-(pentapeptide) pyrophosphoryl-undecaprenol N-acetylglucosamine transferase [Phycisphaerae bacterium]|nr:UDP-N-acetylglucosamine--N-acetylmuramyl-(pentapeptide) pyrophosphoryl-undecaprenol N-acetylglucosamine transferase [Phycisphaerae bacterium]